MVEASNRRRLVVRALWLFLLVAALGGFAYRRATRSLAVAVDRAARGKAVEAIYATGTVEAEERVQVKARAAGALAELLVRAGAWVKRGDLLARIDSPAATYDVVRGRAELRAAVQQSGSDAPRLAALAAQAASLESDLDVARTELKRVSSLAGSGAVPTTDLDRSRGRVTSLEAGLRANAAEQRALRVDLDAARAQKTAQVDVLEAKVNDTEVRAPLEGVVLAKRVEPGEVVSVNQALFMLGDTRSLILELDVDEADIARVRDGRDSQTGTEAAVTLLAFPGRVFKGRVFEILPDADRAKKAFLVKVRLDRPPEGLRSGMTAEVNLIVDAHEGLLVPSAAEAGGFMWVVKDGRAHKRAVKTGIRDPLRIEVLHGLSAGELVVVDGTDALSEGARVTATDRTLARDTPMPDSAVRSQGAL